MTTIMHKLQVRNRVEAALVFKEASGKGSGRATGWPAPRGSRIYHAREYRSPLTADGRLFDLHNVAGFDEMTESQAPLDG